MTRTFSTELAHYPDSFVSFNELGKASPYRPTVLFGGEYINENHRFYDNCPTGYEGISICINIGIDGYLQKADALKIYELAFFAKGNILELGTYKGLSTSIIAQALFDAGSKSQFETVDIDAAANATAKSNVLARSGGDRVIFNLCDATQFMDKAIALGKTYSFIFIDHWHGYETTYEAAMRAKKLLTPGGFCLFHDYNDPSNADPKHVYGVYRAAHDAILCDREFDFYGTFGCTALFRKQD